METSRNAVEAYKRTRLVDFVIQDDDKMAPIYRFDEICEMLRTSSSDMVREVVEYSMKRLGSKSPRVKQKVLRMIKYVVVKGGPEFKRQMQRQAAAVRQLFEYKGQQDVLRGDALNKAVRETAHEAINAIFASDDKPSQSEEIKKRIMGFGSTNYDTHEVADTKMPSLTNVVNGAFEFGSASIKQGLTIISEYSGANIGSLRNDSGSYRGPGLTKSLTSERASMNRFDQDDRSDVRHPPGARSVTTSSPSNHTVHASVQDPTFSRDDTDVSWGRSLEEQLLDTITIPGGIRLQPTRESLQKFLANVVKLDKTKLCHALESKLYAPSWQVRFKTLCVLEAIVQEQNDDFCGEVAAYFEENATSIRNCLQLPQASLKDKASKVLSKFGAASKDSSETVSEEMAVRKDVSQPSVVYDMPDLIDTGDSESLACEKTDAQLPVVEGGASNVSTAGADLLGEVSWAGDTSSTANTHLEDVFTGLSFHMPERGAEDLSDGLFSGLSLNKPSTEDDFLEDKQATTTVQQHVSSDSLMDLLGSATSNDLQKEASSTGSAEINSFLPQAAGSQILHQGSPFQMSENLSQPPLSQVTSPFVNPQMAYLNSSVLQPQGTFLNYQAPVFLHQNYGGQLSSNAFLRHQQFSGGVVGLQRPSYGISGMNGGPFLGLGGNGRAVGDCFDFSGDASLRSPAGADSDQKKNLKAFDFISDHISAARTLKKSS